MERIKKFLLLLICLSGVFLINTKDVKAEKTHSIEILDWYEEYGNGGTKEFTFHTPHMGTLNVDMYSTYAYDSFSVDINDNLGNSYYSRTFEFDEYDYDFKVKLPEGDYTIIFHSDTYIEFSAYVSFEYEATKEDPIFELSKEQLEFYVGENARLSVISYPDDVEFSVTWKSSNPNVASVDKNGKVTGKKAGEAEITATVNGNKYTCTVYILEKLPTYKEVATDAKKYQTKAIKFKQIDVGYESKLLGPNIVGSKFHKKELYGHLMAFQPYIYIKKNGDSANISLYYSGQHTIVSLNRQLTKFTKVKFYTKTRKITYNITSSKRKYKYKKGIYTKDFIWKTKLSDNNNTSIEELNKLIKIFEHKNVTVKIYKGSSWAKMGLPESTRKHTLKLFKTYKKLLKLYE